MENQTEQLNYLESLASRVLEDLDKYSDKVKELLTEEEQQFLHERIGQLTAEVDQLSPEDPVVYVNLLDGIRQLVEVNDKLVVAILGEGYLQRLSNKEEVGKVRALKDIFADDSQKAPYDDNVRYEERIRNHTPKISTPLRKLLKKFKK